MKAQEAELKEKYGDAEVAVVPAALVGGALATTGFVEARKGIVREGNVCGQLLHVAENRMRMMPRYLAELDPSFKQLIPYAVVVNSNTGAIFYTRRLKGDSRLAGRASIGIGGHIEANESVLGGLYREIKEEIGLTRKHIALMQFCGYINENASEVGSVHVGFVFVLFTQKQDIRCLETEKLEGEWAAPETLKGLWKNGKLETWSEIVLESIFVMRD